MRSKEEIQNQIYRVIICTYDMVSNKKIKEIYGDRFIEKLKEDWSDFGDWVYEEGEFQDKPSINKRS